MLPSTAVVACSRLTDYGGSEIATLEIAEGMQSLGIDVELATLECGEPMRSSICKTGIPYKVLPIESLKRREYDLLWVSHNVAAYELLLNSGASFKTTIFSCLSYTEPLEVPPPPSINFNRYVVNSYENYEFFRARYPEFSEKVGVFENACPKSYLGAYKSRESTRLARLAVVSNHVPDEVLRACAVLQAGGISTKIIGISGEYERVTAKLLSEYDGVITIGKTVQYCLATGVPVFCYDHFGGPGWIRPDNIQGARRANFSGRDIPRKLSPADLATQIISGFKETQDALYTLHLIASRDFNLEENLKSTLSNLPISGESLPTVTQRNALMASTEVFRRLRSTIEHYKVAAEDSRNQARELDLLIKRERKESADREDELHSKLQQAIAELKAMSSSRSWRSTKVFRVSHDCARRNLARCHTVLVQEGIFWLAVKVVREPIRRIRRRFTMFRLSRIGHSNKQHTSQFPLVSFIIPVYDRTDLLRASIKSALEQRSRSVEVIIVTDGSPIETMNVVNEFRDDKRVRIYGFPTSSGNAVRGRNKGILEAAGKYIAFLDSDDTATPDRVEVSLPLLEANEADVVYGGWRAVLDGSREVDSLQNGQEIYSPDCDIETLKKICVPCQSTVMVRRDLLLKVGLLKPVMKYREDHELWLRLAENGARFKAIPKVITNLRLHSGNNELNFKDNDSLWEKLLLEEYRQEGPKPKKIAFLLASMDISGGAMVVLRHVRMLMDAGHDAFIISLSGSLDFDWYGDRSIRVYSVNNPSQWSGAIIDTLVATFWTTVAWLERIESKEKAYFVQSDERLFYEDASTREAVESTYRLDIKYLTISKWLTKMLTEDFGRTNVHYVPNGIDLDLFHKDVMLEPKPRDKLRVLIEGPISVPFKGVQDSYNALLNINCERWIVSSNGKPPKDWIYDRFFEKVDHQNMRRIYSSCDVLLKMSRVESFAYPPLEAMACGCVPVVAEVAGGIEYAQHEVNLLVVPYRDCAAAGAAISRLAANRQLLSELRANGLITANRWQWSQAATAMLQAIGGQLGHTSVCKVSAAHPSEFTIA